MILHRDKGIVAIPLTDIEGSTRLWERDAERLRGVLDEAPGADEVARRMAEGAAWSEEQAIAAALNDAPERTQP